MDCLVIDDATPSSKHPSVSYLSDPPHGLVRIPEQLAAMQ